MESSSFESSTPRSTSLTSENNDTAEDVHPHFAALSDELEGNLPTETPYKQTIDLYKERCSELETELVHQHVATTVKNLEIETLKTKVAMLTEYYRTLEDSMIPKNGSEGSSSCSKIKEEARIQSKEEALSSASPPPAEVLRLAVRCAELEAGLNAKQAQETPKIVLHATTHTVTENKQEKQQQQQQQRASIVAGPELLALLRSACRQLEEARRVGSQLRLKLARQNRPVINL
jgi:hypothetical protein